MCISFVSDHPFRCLWLKPFLSVLLASPKRVSQEGAPNFPYRGDPRSPVPFFVETLRFPAAWICPGSFLDLLLDPEQF